jgi:hypothetical protein
MTPTEEAAERHVKADIQVILTVIGRRDLTHDPPDREVNQAALLIFIRHVTTAACGSSRCLDGT